MRFPAMIKMRKETQQAAQIDLTGLVLDGREVKKRFCNSAARFIFATFT
jgi:hypothetical protein